MSGKWKKIVWAVFMLQLCVLHIAVFIRFRVDIALLVYDGGGRMNLPVFLYKYGAWTVAAVWLFVSGLILVKHIIQYQVFRRKCIEKLSLVEDQGILNKYRESCASLGLQSDGREQIYFGPGIGTPFVLGFLRPLLLLPQSCRDQESLELVLLHECIHLKNRDTLYKLFLLLGTSFLWFQPLAYLARYFGYRDLEAACDEEAVKDKTMEERYAYGQFLLENLKQSSGREYAYSAFFCNGKRLMKARIAAVMEENTRWNGWAAAAVVLMLMEATVLACFSVARVLNDYHTATDPVNIYKGYEKPEGFSQAALDGMLLLTPQDKDAYYRYLQKESYNEEDLPESFDQLPYEAQGPWQIRVLRMSHYGDCVLQLFTRYLYYDKDQEWASIWDPEQYGNYPPLDTLHQRLLAGDERESVWGMIFREYLPEGEEPVDTLKDWAIVGQEGSERYVYYPVAVHVKMTNEHVFQLEGIHSLYETMEAYGEKYPQTDFTDVPRLDIQRDNAQWGLEGAESGKGESGNKESGQIDTGKTESDHGGSGQSDSDVTNVGQDRSKSSYEVSTAQGELKIRRPGKEWEAVPITLETLFSRGDEMDGRLNTLQEGSYQCDDTKQIFAYGGDITFYGDSVNQGGTPVSVKYYDQEAGGWKESVVTMDYFGGRKLFVSFPENSMDGFLIMTGERVMWQEATLLFKTTDGGKSWTECGAGDRNGEFNSHSLTVEGTFLTNEVGFLTIRDSDKPHILRTGDGGESWQRVELEETVEYYGMAYAPIWEENRLVMYVGMEDYGKNQGTQIKYVSEDLGLSWRNEGLVMRK